MSVAPRLASVELGLLGSVDALALHRVSGDGVAFVHGAGDLVERALGEGERLVVDAGCVVAFDERVRCELEFVGSLRLALFGGRGLFRARSPGRARATCSRSRCRRRSPRARAARPRAPRAAALGGGAGVGGALARLCGRRRAVRDASFLMGSVVLLLEEERRRGWGTRGAVIWGCSSPRCSERRSAGSDVVVWVAP